LQHHRFVVSRYHVLAYLQDAWPGRLTALVALFAAVFFLYLPRPPSTPTLGALDVSGVSYSVQAKMASVGPTNAPAASAKTHEDEQNAKDDAIIEEYESTDVVAAEMPRGTTRRPSVSLPADAADDGKHNDMTKLHQVSAVHPVRALA